MFSIEGYEALHQGLALVRRPDRGVIRVTGADRSAWLQGLVTNDVLALQPGRRLYSAWLSPQGRMITDLWVAATPDALLLDVPAPLAASLASKLDSLIFAEDVQIDAAGGGLDVTLVVGAAGSVDEAPGGSSTVVVHDETYGRPALVVYGAGAAGLAAAGLEATSHATEVDLDTFEVFRIEAGVPRFLVDMTEDTIPLEAGIEDRAISFTKGCYVGQEIIVRVTTRGGGRVAKRLVGLTLGSGPADLVPAGATLHAGGKGVGQLTSVAWSPRLGNVIALGYVHRDFVTPGTRLEVQHGETSPTPAVVTATPFLVPDS